MTATPNERDEEAEAKQRLAHYREILQGLYDAVLICGHDCRVVEANARAEKMLRQSASSLIGRLLSALVVNFTPEIMRRIEQRLVRGRFTVLEAYCVRGDETVFPAEIAISRVQLTPAGEFIFSIRNIEWRKKTEAAIRRETEAQMARARAEDDFSGYLNIVSISDVLQLIEASRKSGTLTIADESGDETATVHVLDGQVVKAQCGELSGEAAVYEIVRRGGAAFFFRQGRPTERDPITQSTLGLLLEASRRVDEGNRAALAGE